MRYKWKPTKAQKREFAERMATDTAYNEAYHQRKEQRAKTRRSTSKFDYQTAGGEYIPTESQNKAAFELLNLNPTPEQEEACNMVLYGYSCKEKVHHDFIHLINNYMRQGARTDLTLAQNVLKLSTAEEIGKQYGVDEKTIRRDAEFSKVVDKVAEEIGKEAKEAIL